MELTKVNIVNRVNKLLVSYKSDWDDIVDALDMAIDEINTYLSTKYPPVSQVLNEHAAEDATYSYRAGGINVPFFPQKYFLSIVIPFVATEILTIDEEFSDIYNRYRNQYQENLFVMARDEMSSIPPHLFSAPRGVYFTNPNAAFKSDPEDYFNRQIEVDVPKLKVFYSWGNILLGTEGITSFVSKPLPVDNNSYEIGSAIMPVVMQDTNFNTFIVDKEGNVLATFLGWSLVETGEDRPIVNEAIIMSEDLRFYAVFDYDIVRFKYEGNGGTVQNWRPMYTNGQQTPVDVIPYGGTAIRKGHKFIGFDPTLITAEEVFNRNELDDINDYKEEEEFTFTAQWNLVVYSLDFVNIKTTLNLGRSGYMFGEEFDLIDPEADPSSPDEFIGWWDNPLFEGDPVTKIYESDYGDKTFYAKYNNETFMIIWLNEDGTEIKIEPLSKNTLLTAPEVGEEEEFTADETMEGLIPGRLYIKEFLGFVNEDGDAPTRATKNDTFTANYRTVAVMSTIEINFYRNNEGTIETGSKTLSYQVGETLDKGKLIVSLGEDRLYESTDVPSVTQFVSDLSLTEDGDPISGETFTMGKEVVVYGLYSVSSINITFERKIWDTETSALIIDPEYSPLVVEVPSGSSYSYVVGLVSIDATNIQSVIDTGESNVYLNEFKKWIEEEEVDASDGFTSNTTLRPVYGSVASEEFTRTLTIIGLPSHEISKTTTTKVFEVPMNIALNLNGTDYEFCKQTINEDDDYLFLQIDGFYLYKIGSFYFGKIDSISTFSNMNIYVKTSSKEQFDIYLDEFKIKTVYPYELIDSVDRTIDALDFIQILPPATSGYKFIGWNHDATNAAAGVVDNTITIDQFRTEDLIFHPVYEVVEGFKVNVLFTDENGNALITDFTKGENIELNFSPSFQNKTSELFSNYNDLINLINGTTIKTRQQAGYNFYRWKQDAGILHDSFGVNINFPEAGTEVTQINLTFQLIRNTLYSLVTISPTMMNLSTNSYQSAYDEYKDAAEGSSIFKVFVLKNSIYYQVYFGSDTGWSTYLPQLIHSNDIVGGLHDPADPETNYNYFYRYNSSQIQNSDKAATDITIQLVRSGVL